MTRPTRATSAGRAYLDLQARARRERRLTEELLVLYVLERFLFRLSRSPHRSRLVLKGGMLLAAFEERRSACASTSASVTPSLRGSSKSTIPLCSRNRSGWWATHWRPCSPRRS